MTRKRALIVDDSKSARVVLSRMLEKYGIEVDMAESAEQSIAYLEHNRPDAIFMDHLMPGMDGLQAVQAIKANPRTAMIPIMMYTSQEGELYVGQARALGAMGVLPKQLRPVDVSKVLYELHLLPERRDVEESALTPVELAPSAAAAPADYLGRRVEAAVRGQTTEMRRFILTSLEGFATRVVGELRDLPPRAPPEQPPARGSIAASIAAVLVATGFAVLWMGARDEIARLRAQLAARSATLTNIERSRDQLDAIIKRLTAAGASAASPTAALP
ncbi:MAG: response regulator, partial [Steroidobacteraceae bacterium]|nr:response regulator [Steroidobacteraceae bacterium]